MLHIDHVMYIMLILVISLYSLHPTLEEPKLEAQADQVEEANPEPGPEQGKPRCITPQFLTFILN
jgi:hypothetical protein